MKRFFLGTLVFVSAVMFSQQRSKGDIELTPKIGYSSSNYYGEENLNNNSKSDFTFGLESDYFFNDRWSLHSGLLYQSMGSEVVNGYEENLNYLTIPINANWHFGSTRKWYLNFGPSIGFLMSAKDSEGNDFKDKANSTQIGLNYGIGYKIFINDKFSLSIDYQGMTGLSDVPKDSDFTIKNAYSSFNIGGVIKL